MRRKRRKNQDVVIDLNSLLDVIFIILLVVLLSQRDYMSQIVDKKNDYEQMRVEAEKAKEIYEEHIDSEQILESIVIKASFSPDNVIKRKVIISVKGKDIATYELTGNDVEEQWNELYNNLARFVESKSDRPIIVSFNEDDEEVLYRDEKRILDVMNRLMEYTNVYIK